MRCKYLCVLLFFMQVAVADDAPDVEFNAISLTRFAIQQLYAPERLLTSSTGISRVPMQVARTINLLYGASVSARPIASWQGSHLYVTAIELRNNLNKVITLDPRQVQGDFQTASFFPSSTLPPRNQHESITLFVTSDKPFKDALVLHSEFAR